MKSEFVYVSYIKTTPEKLWHALTTSEVVKQWWFGVVVESDWKVGSPWRTYYDGNLMDSGEILESVPQKRLVRSWFNQWVPELKAEGKTQVVCEIEPFGTSVKLTIIHASERPHSKYIEATSVSWPMCISNLKSLLETGDVAIAGTRETVSENMASRP